MTINEKIISNKELKISDWELDFYSRPIIENNGKKRWELIISSSKSFKTEKIFLWNKVCPANEVNSIWLTKALNEALNDAEREGWAKPLKIRFWRASMKKQFRIKNLKYQIGSWTFIRGQLSKKMVKKDGN